MGVPWNYGPTEFDVEGATDSVVELRVPHRGTIKQLIIDERGAAGAATFQIFTSEVAAYVAASTPGYVLSDVVGQSTLAHSIMGIKNVVAGSFADYAVDTAYRNGDGTSTNPVRSLWLVITPGTAGTKSYTLSMGIEMPDLVS